MIILRGLPGLEWLSVSKKKIIFYLILDRVSVTEKAPTIPLMYQTLNPVSFSLFLCYRISYGW